VRRRHGGKMVKDQRNLLFFYPISKLVARVKARSLAVQDGRGTFGSICLSLARSLARSLMAQEALDGGDP